MCAALLPDEADDRARPVLLPRPRPGPASRACAGTGARRVLLLGHLDTVVAHADAPAAARATASSSSAPAAVDMKGGDVLALGALRALAARPERLRRGRAAARVRRGVADARRSRHVERFAGWDACLCFEAGELAPDGDEGVVVRRKAAGTIRVDGARPRRALRLGARPRAQRAARARRAPPRRSPAATTPTARPA